jgi:hypothetical protein
MGWIQLGSNPTEQELLQTRVSSLSEITLRS